MKTIQFIACFAIAACSFISFASQGYGAEQKQVELISTQIPIENNQQLFKLFLLKSYSKNYETSVEEPIIRVAGKGGDTMI